MTSLVVVGAIVLLICLGSMWSFLKRRSPAAVVQLSGAGLLLVMVLTHIAERFHLLTAMRWGSPNSIGHYVDFASAIGGVVLLCASYVMKRGG